MSTCIVCSEIIPSTRLTRRKDVKYCSPACVKTQWALLNPEKQKKAQAKYLEVHKDRRAASSKAYTQRNKPYYNSYSSLRNRKKTQAKPAWADDKIISWFYEEAAYFGLEVDHIIPITHPRVCGLHVPNNLQLLTRSENARKCNKFDDDVICKITKVIK